MVEKKSIAILILILLIFCTLTACTPENKQIAQTNQSNTNHQSTNKNDTTQPKELLNGLCEKSLKEEQDFLEAEKKAKQMINSGRIMIEEFDKINIKNKDDSWIPLFDFANEWISTLNFAGYQTTTGIGMYPRFFAPDDYYMFQQMIIETERGQKLLEYNVFFVRDYEFINMERYSLFLKAVFGIDISAEKLKDAVLVCEEKLPTVTQGNQFDHILYEKDKIVIKMVAMEDVTSEKYIAICSRYRPES